MSRVSDHRTDLTDNMATHINNYRVRSFVLQSRVYVNLDSYLLALSTM